MYDLEKKTFWSSFWAFFGDVDRLPNAFKGLGMLTTFAEIINLSIQAMEKGVHIVAAITRYPIPGLVEVLTTFLFIERFSNDLKVAAADHKITGAEILMIARRNVWFFLLAFMVTAYIDRLYLSSINQYEIVYEPSNFFESLIPPLGMRVETDCNRFTEAPCIDNDLRKPVYDPVTATIAPVAKADPCLCKQPVDPAAQFLIYSTPGINFLLVVFLIIVVKRNNKRYWDEQEELEQEHIHNNEQNINSFNFNSLQGGLTYLEKVFENSRTGFDAQNFIDFAYEYCGIKIETDTDGNKEYHFSVNANTHPKVKTFINTVVPSGGDDDSWRSDPNIMDPEGCKQEITSFIIGSTGGSDAIGVKHLQAIGTRYHDVLKQKLELDGRIKSKQEQINTMDVSDQRKPDIQAEIDGMVSNVGNLQNDLSKATTDYNVAVANVIQELEDIKYPWALSYNAANPSPQFTIPK
jgi:hypothetical protein